ncbi:MAG: dehydrogenase subunit [Fluviicola sp.]|jgi:NADH-quinone oxidoreductase subunit J|uniref:NADH-quinone oxidoreductase subunit J family protein n=1 Tax=Fluviicola sp. TaxID=1917219 RepID=UPI00262C1BA2|nr:NADH-quinone oxidoreductase subunit J [Fluviicola sp.]MDF3027861.1 dehydrogenase subunit [Fluviicola sp.]
MSLDILFYILGGLTIGTALMVVLSKHPVRSVLYLVLTFFLISANYVLMNAQFIAIVNIIVYAGAIMVLFLFVLMLLNLNKENEPKHSPLMTIGAAIAGGALFLVVVAAMREAILATPMIDTNSEKVGLVENLGQVLFTKYVLPFEVSSILFLAAMVGAVLLAKKEKQTIE